MKTISQNVDLTFVRPTLKDAMKMAPMMDAIVNDLNNHKALTAWSNLSWKLQHANRAAGVVVPDHQYFSYFPIEQVEDFYKLLLSCGFESMVERKDFELKLVYHTEDELPRKEAKA